MNRDEALGLCRYVKACCPQQAIDEYTPDAWADHLADYPYADAKQAARTLTAKQPFVTIAELLAVVRHIRDKRIAEAGDLTPPADLTPTETIAWLGQARRRLADGEDRATVEADYGVLRERYLPDLRQLMPSPDTDAAMAGSEEA